MPVAGGLVTMSRAQSANQEDHLADNVVKCVCTYCTHRIIYIIHIKAQRASKEENKNNNNNNNNQKDHLADNVVKCVCEKVAAHTTHTEIDVQSTGRKETKTIW